MTRMSTTMLRRFPCPDLASLVDNLHDSSWGNDECDSLTFSINGIGYVLWVDAMRYDERANDSGCASTRLCFVPLAIEGDLQDTLDERTPDPDADCLETDDPDAIVAHIRALKAKV